MNSYTRILLLAWVIISSCAEATIQEPKDILPEETFVELLVEMNMIEAVRSMNLTKEVSAKIETEAFYNELWERHQIDQEQFLKSFEFYRVDALKMSDLYRQAADILKRKEDDINAEKKIEKASPKSQESPAK